MYCPKCKDDSDSSISEVEIEKVETVFNPEEIVEWGFLVSVVNSFEGECLAAFLGKADIPVMKNLSDIGSFGSMLMGNVNMGVDIYVPKDCMVQAHELITGYFNPVENCEELDGEDDLEEYPKIKFIIRSIAWILALIFMTLIFGPFIMLIVAAICGLYYAKKRKVLHKILIGLGCCFLAVCLFFALQPQIVTGKRSDLQQIVVVADKFRDGKPALEIIITDEDCMYSIYNKLRFSLPVRRAEIDKLDRTYYEIFPPSINIKLVYSNGEDNVYYLDDGSGFAVRYLEESDSYSVGMRSVYYDILSLVGKNYEKQLNEV